MINHVFNCDCMAWMRSQKDCIRYMGREFPFSQVLAIPDPPYGIGSFLHSGSNYCPEKIEWNDEIPSPEYFGELFRISKHQIIWGGNYYTEILKPTKSWIVWHKKMSNPFKSKISDAELAWTSLSIGTTVAVISWASGFYRRRIENIIHECQKPIALGEWLLLNYAKPEQLIVDTHVGSGYMRIACKNLGLNFLGCEKDPRHWKDQEKRYREHIVQPSLISTEEIQDCIYRQREL